MHSAGVLWRLGRSRWRADQSDPLWADRVGPLDCSGGGRSGPAALVRLRAGGAGCQLQHSGLRGCLLQGPVCRSEPAWPGMDPAGDFHQQRVAQQRVWRPAGREMRAARQPDPEEHWPPLGHALHQFHNRRRGWPVWIEVRGNRAFDRFPAAGRAFWPVYHHPMDPAVSRPVEDHLNSPVPEVFGGMPARGRGGEAFTAWHAKEFSGGLSLQSPAARAAGAAQSKRCTPLAGAGRSSGRRGVTAGRRGRWRSSRCVPVCYSSALFSLCRFPAHRNWGQCGPIPPWNRVARSAGRFCWGSC